MSYSSNEDEDEHENGFLNHTPPPPSESTPGGGATATSTHTNHYSSSEGEEDQDDYNDDGDDDGGDDNEEEEDENEDIDDADAASQQSLESSFVTQQNDYDEEEEEEDADDDDNDGDEVDEEDEEDNDEEDGNTSINNFSSRISMTSNTSDLDTSMQETSMDIDKEEEVQEEEGDDDDDEEDNEENGDEGMADEDEAANVSSSSVIVPGGGKTLRPLRSDDDDSDDGDNDDNVNDDGKNNGIDNGIDISESDRDKIEDLQDQTKHIDEENNGDISAENDSKVAAVAAGVAAAVQSRPPVSGKPLSIITTTMEENESSSDDELLLSHRTTRRKSTKRKSTSSTKKLSTPSESSKTKKKKTPSTVATAEIVEDDAIEAVALVNDGSDSDTVEAVVIPQAPPKKKRKKPGPKPKKKPKEERERKKPGPKPGQKKKNANSAAKSKSKKRRIGSGNDSDSEGSCYAASVIPHERMKAAETAREILTNSVQRTPFIMSESHTIRNFGRIKIEEKNVAETKYCNATAIYPVGFSCDRYEFSPIHGRFLKLRCDILDAETKDKATEVKTGPKNGNSIMKKGPIFRIMWGRGIDEIDNSQTFPFDLYSSSTPIVNEVDAVAIPDGKDAIKIKPEQGMRVKVRFDKNIWYLGNILQVSVKKNPIGSDKKSSKKGASLKKEKKQKYNVQILYDNGVKEDVTFPDPDIVLVAPGKNLITCLFFIDLFILTNEIS